MFRVSEHPLIAVKLTQLREEERAPEPQNQGQKLNCATYSHLTRQLTTLLAYEVMEQLDTFKKHFVTESRGRATGVYLNNISFVLVPILRSGMVMQQAFQEVLPNAFTGHIGIHRIKGYHERGYEEYIVSLPTPTPDKIFIVLDPVIAEGVTADTTICILKNAGVEDKNIRFVSIVSSSFARKFLEAKFPNVSFYCASEDNGVDVNANDGRSGVNKMGQVVPGLGSVSNHLFGYKSIPRSH